ncbi:MAG: adenylate/guanylate cyclase domain-containing protein [Motiliproteus sp.]
MIGKLRLVTGLVLASFVILHLSNHALGLVSLAWVDGGSAVFISFWHHPFPSLLLAASFLTHGLLALRSLYKRTTLKMPLWEGLQLLLGLSIIPLLIAHVIGTRLSSELLGFELKYETTVGILWAIDNGVLKQTTLLLVVWLHLMIGLHYWQRLNTGYQRWLPFWQLLASLLPILSLLGFYRLGYQIGATDLAARSAALIEQNPTEMVLLGGLEQQILTGYLVLLIATLLARQLRHLFNTKGSAIIINHPLRGAFTARRGQTLLEALREAGIAHSSVCGGRARCTTCRVRVVQGQQQLEPVSSAERDALKGIKAEADVRLACQLVLTDNLSIVPLIPPEMGGAYVRKPGGVEGQEQRVTVLFIDLRGSTRLAEQRLPYDVVFILNQFFAEMAEVLRQTDGHYAQFNGDGLMALYGLDGNYVEGCRKAIIGAQKMLQRLEQLNQKMGSELQQPLKVGIGIHSGEAIVGTMGPPESPILSAIGDTINSAARIESETKKESVSLIISKQTLDSAGFTWPQSKSKQIEIRGRSQLLDVVIIRDPLAVSF